MSRDTALEYDRQLSAIPLYVKDDREGVRLHPSRDIFRDQWAEMHGVVRDVPVEAKDAGCRNCLYDDRLRHPELTDHLYCAVCPCFNGVSDPKLLAKGGAECAD